MKTARTWIDEDFNVAMAGVCHPENSLADVCAAMSPGMTQPGAEQIKRSVHRLPV